MNRVPILLSMMPMIKKSARDKNVTWLKSPKEIAENVDIVVTCIPISRRHRICRLV